MERLFVEPASTPISASKPPVALAIAGFDPSSGAGITADLLVFQAHGIFGTSAITALTVQSTLGVTAVEPLSGGLFTDTLKHLNSDLPPQGIKIGMLGSSEIVAATADYLEQSVQDRHGKRKIPIILDPVLIASSGAELLPSAALKTLRARLLPLVDWITPNWSELALLSSQPVVSMAQAEAAAGTLIQSYPTLGLIVTGGDQDTPTDLFYPCSGGVHHLAGEHIETRSTHGTGCAFSTSFLSNLIHKKPALDAAHSAKHYVTEAIRRAPGLGHGRGPLDLLWPLRPSHIDGC